MPPSYATCRGGHRAYTESALVMLPEHDRSMVFNVITIYSTFFAFIFGSVMTTLVRRSPQKHRDDQLLAAADKPRHHGIPP